MTSSPSPSVSPAGVAGSDYGPGFVIVVLFLVALFAMTRARLHRAP